MQQSCKNLSFFFEPLDEFVILAGALVQHLDRYLSVERLLDGAIDRSHAAATDFAFDVIADQI